jgi:predicted ATP-grasp superfamily ATP-dependent carboligase
MSVLVTDGDQRSTLAVVRALGAAGVPVTVGECRPRSLAGSSRFAARTVCYPSPHLDPEGFQNFLREESQSGNYRVLLPMTDVTVLLASELAAEILLHAALPFPARERILEAQDKGYLLRLGQQAGIAAPATWEPGEQAPLQEIAHTIAYPAVLKPRFSRWRSGGHWITGSVEYVENAQDLIAQYTNVHAQVPCPLIQEKIEGEGRGVFLLVWNGELKAAFCHRRLREKPPWGGVSVYRESLPPDDALIRQSFALLQLLQWQGVAMLEFKMDRRDGLAKLMEMNGRFWGSLQLASDAGMNFPLLLYRLACGENLPPQFDYRAGVKSRWLLGDLDHLWLTLTPRREHIFQANGVSRMRACARFLKFYEKNLHYEICRFNDWQPGWFEFAGYLRHALRRRGRA